MSKKKGFCSIFNGFLSKLCRKQYHFLTELIKIRVFNNFLRLKMNKILRYFSLGGDEIGFNKTGIGI
jgi:hypothetical protein